MRGAVTVLFALCLVSPAAAQESHLLIIAGLGGDPAYSAQFHTWATTLLDAARDRYELPDEQMTYLAEKPDRDPELIDGRSTRENVEAAITELAERARPNDKVFIVLIGHGSFTGGESRFNLPGRDLTAEDFTRLLNQLRSQRVTFANTSSASGGFIEALSGRDRVIVTATKTGGERNEAVFGGFFVEALAGGGEADVNDEADLNKDGQVSILEAFNYARREVARTYESDGRLLTEHAILDDNGDGEGSAEPDLQTADGGLARTLFLAAGPIRRAAAAAAGSDPALRALYDERQALEERLEALKLLKDGMDLARYEQELETLLVALALKSRAIRETEESREAEEPPEEPR